MTFIREAAAKDSEAVFTLAADFATTFTPNRQIFEASFNRLMARDDALMLVAEQAGMVCAYLLGFDHDSLFANGPVAWIEELMVRGDRRRNGMGAGLVRRFEEWARSRNARMIALATRRAAPFYNAIGFEKSAAYFRKLL